MVVRGSKGRIALGALSLPRLVARPQAVVAEAMEAFGQHSVLPLDLAAGAGQGLLVLANFLLENLVKVRGHLDFAQPLHLPLD